MVIWSTKMHFVSIQTVPEMHSCGHFEQQNAFREHQTALASEWDWQANAFKWSFGTPKNAFREHSNCAQNAFVSESDWQANAFKWSFGAPKMLFVSIQTVPEMHLLLSRIGKQMHSNGHLEHKKCFS